MNLMRIAGPEDQPLEDEWQVITRMLPLQDAKILELGCGAAQKTRQIAERGGIAHLVASEVDPIQHAKNLTISDLADVTFKSYPAQAIYEDADRFDIVMMFKSLHHVPGEHLDAAFAEIHRVLKPGGWLYLSEPVFAGALNDVIRLFHDEEQVRKDAFAATVKAVASAGFELTEQAFFRTPVRMASFEQFEQGVINATHTEHQLSADLMAQVRARFENNRQADGYYFEPPHRVDLLRKC